MLFILWLFSFKIIFCSNYKNNVINKKVNNSNVLLTNKLLEGKFKNKEIKKRKLQNYENIKITIDYTCLESQLILNEELFSVLKKSLDEVKEIVEKLIKVKKMNINFSELDVPLDQHLYSPKKICANVSLLDENNDSDLIIFVRARERGEVQLFTSIINKYEVQDIKRPVVGTIIVNDEFNLYPNEEKSKQQFFSIIFLHEFTHILGFRKEIFQEKNVMSSDYIKSRINSGQTINKFFINSPKVMELAKSYYNCDDIYGIELDMNDNNDFCNINTHWEARLLLGDYMTSKIYYPEQYISEFTLALLEDLGWYKINYYTGGLMRFGKNQGCDFIKKDCVEIVNSNAISSFYNDFCNYDSFSTCSSGRQSRGYCYYRYYKNDIRTEFLRPNWDFGYGLENAENCPVSLETKKDSNNYYIGHCYFGNSNFGNELETNYNSYSIIFGEKYGENSSCILSSILKKNENAGPYKNLVRPSCYSMECNNKTLTIILYSNNNNLEYVVCPRKGGLIKVGIGTYTNYTGYLFCPDYNLICTGTTLCNNIFDCVRKESLKKEPQYNYDYKINYITSDIREAIKHDNFSENEVIEGFEVDENGRCPVNCSQCISHKRCTLCRKFNQNYPYAYYIGEKDDKISHINCSSIKPLGEYYNITKYDNHIHYFRCIDNCNVCTNASICEQCLPTHKIDNKTSLCIDRVSNCLKYNESFFLEHDPENGGGKGYIECIHCDNKNKYFCMNMNKNICEYVEDYSDEAYYKMEDNQQYSCIQKCDIKFKHCKECVKNRCKICESKYFVNSSGLCEERIPNCIKYNESSIFNDHLTNGGGEGYRECEKCNISSNYYCLNNNKTICKEIKPEEKNQYYKMDDNDDYSCMGECNLKFPYCLECNKTNCNKCIVDISSKNGSCFPPISGCSVYDKHEENNIEYLDCKECDQNNSYYCLNDNRKNCELIDNISHYYKINDDDFSCLKSCEETFSECKSCNRSYCFECNDGYVLSNQNKTKCLVAIKPPDDDECKIIFHNISLNIKELEFEYFIDFYFNNTLPYTKHIDHFINENYTVTMFIHSECTEDLLNQGYYKIDSNELYKEMYDKAGIESNELLFSIFVSYNYQNHYRFYNIYTQYINETVICPECLNIPYIITNKYTTIIDNVLGPLISNYLNNEKVDIFSKDSDIFTDSCKNVTLEGVDIPFNERMYYLFLNDYSTQIACTGKDCEIEEINTEESISVCKCKIGNKFQDILEPIIEFQNYEDENMNKSSSISDSLKIIKCAKNGFNKKNILTNAGFYIAIVAIVLVIGCFISYCICSKVINLKKLSNPPIKVKNRILISSDWNTKENNADNNNKENFDNDLIQSRDEDDGNVLEEDLTFTNDFDKSSFSIDTEIGFGKKKDDTNKGNKDGIKGSLKRRNRKILVLLANKRVIKNSAKNINTDSEIEHEFIHTDKAKRKEKKTFCQIYWFILSIKQHIINFFSGIKCCKITESYVPLPMRAIKSTFIVVLSFLLNILFLTQNYFSKKFKYFNQEYKLIVTKHYEYEIKPDEISDGNIPASESWKYAFSHTIINSIIVFIILLLIQFIIGLIFFSVRNSVLDVIRKNNLNEIKDLILKTKIKYIVFFILALVLLVIFLFTFIGFGGAYGGASIDYLVPGLISIAILEVFPFIWSLILAILRYIGIKKDNKCCFDFSQFFLF